MPLAIGVLALLACSGRAGPRTTPEQPGPAAAAGLEWTWADRFGGRGRDAPRAVATAAGGQVYSVGQLAHARDPSERSWSGNAARELMFLARHGRDGRREWILRFGGSPVDEPRAVAVAPDGTVLVAGLFAGELGFGAPGGLPAIAPVGGADAFLLGIDGSGTPRWALCWGGKYADAARALAVDDGGNVYLAGTFQLTADFDPGAGRALMTSAGRSDVFVLKLDPERRLVWARQLGGEGADEVTALAVAADGTVYLGGATAGRWADEGAEEGGSASADAVPTVFVVALAPDGTRRWRRRFVSDRAVALAGLATGDDGAIYAGGSFQGALRSAGPIALANPAGWDLFVARLAANGELVWMRDVGVDSEQSLTAQALTTTVAGPLLAGWFQGSVDFDPGPASAPLQAETTAGFLLALDADGALSWAGSPAAAGYSQVLAIAAAGDGSAAAVGVGQPGTVFRARRSTGGAPELGKSDAFVLGFRVGAPVSRAHRN
jgi:hypothetical protein